MSLHFSFSGFWLWPRPGHSLIARNTENGEVLFHPSTHHLRFWEEANMRAAMSLVAAQAHKNELCSRGGRPGDLGFLRCL